MVWHGYSYIILSKSSKKFGKNFGNQLLNVTLKYYNPSTQKVLTDKL